MKGLYEKISLSHFLFSSFKGQPEATFSWLGLLGVIFLFWKWAFSGLVGDGSMFPNLLYLGGGFWRTSCSIGLGCSGVVPEIFFNAWNPQKMPEVILDIIDAFRTSEFVWKRPMNLWRPVFSKVNVEFSIKVASVFRCSAVLVTGFQCDAVSDWSLVRSPPTCHQEGIEWWIPVETHHGRDWQVEILGVFGDDLVWGSWLSFLTEVGSW